VKELKPKAPSPPLNESAFNDLILKICDNVLLILGETVKDATYLWINTNYGIAREEIANRFGDFIKGIQSIYGSNANVVLIGLTNLLCRQFELKSSSNDFEHISIEKLMETYCKCQRSMLRKKKLG
jgi:hypothetical protein